VEQALNTKLNWKGWRESGHPLPGPDAHAPFMPYGRTSASEARKCGEVGVDFREAAVLIGIEADGRLALIERAPYGGVHGGQMALPGGAREAGESMLECALREWREELGLGVHHQPLQPPVAMTEVHVAPSRFIVRPFLAPVQLPNSLSPDPIEVARVHRVHIEELLDADRRAEDQVQVGGGIGLRLKAPGWRLSEVPFVWGATAMMLGELASIVEHWSGDGVD
jgi:8-oxo-dGTP pyrophosphatase MutT (NUDIX family)